jgi:hypothetical protein
VPVLFQLGEAGHLAALLHHQNSAAGHAGAPLGKRDRGAMPVEAVANLAGEGSWSLEALYGDTSSQITPAQRRRTF